MATRILKYISTVKLQDQIGVSCGSPPHSSMTNHTIYIRRETTSTVYFISRSRTKKEQDWDQETPDPAVDQWMKKVTKVNENKQWTSVFRWNLLSMEFRCILLNLLNRRHPLEPDQWPLKLFLILFIKLFCSKRVYTWQYSNKDK